jgi:AMP phosphorylase
MMLLKAKPLPLEADKPIAVLNKEDAKELGVKPLGRVRIKSGKKEIVAIVNEAERIVKPGEIGLYEDILERLKLDLRKPLLVSPEESPKSLIYIKRKMKGCVLTKGEIDAIVKDTVSNKLSDIELTAFVTSLYNHGMTMSEILNLSMAMKNAGSSLDLGGGKTIYDKHSIGGIPGDKTSIIVVPIVAAAGLTIPKTSSRAITSPAGTADRFECIAPVNLSIEQIKKVVKKTGGCIVWGGAVDLSPADDMFIKIEYPLSIDPFLLPSVMSKKKAVGAKYLVIDIPTGDEAKITTSEEFENLADKFITLGKKMGITVNAVSTYADEPLGFAVGPAIEAREALKLLMTGEGPADLIDKAATIAGVLLSFAGHKDGKTMALHILKSGKAYRKLREIIEAQGGNPDIKPKDIRLGSERAEIISKHDGIVKKISNRYIAILARQAGAPAHRGAGVLLHKKIGDKVKKGDVLFEIYAEKKDKLKLAEESANNLEAMRVGKRSSVTLERLPDKGNHREYFILER